MIAMLPGLAKSAELSAETAATFLDVDLITMMKFEKKERADLGFKDDVDNSKEHNQPQEVQHNPQSSSILSIPVSKNAKSKEFIFTKRHLDIV